MVKFDPLNEYVNIDSSAFRAKKRRWVRRWTLSFGLAGAVFLGSVMALGAAVGMGVLEAGTTAVQVIASFLAGSIMGFVPGCIVGAFLGLLIPPTED